MRSSKQHFHLIIEITLACWLSARCLVLWSRINDLLLFFNKFEAHLQCFKVYFYTKYVMISLLYVLAQFRFQWYFYQDKTSFNLFSLRLNRCIIVIKHSVYADWCPKIILIIRKTIYTVKNIADSPLYW